MYILLESCRNAVYYSRIMIITQKQDDDRQELEWNVTTRSDNDSALKRIYLTISIILIDVVDS